MSVRQSRDWYVALFFSLGCHFNPARVGYAFPLRISQWPASFRVSVTAPACSASRIPRLKALRLASSRFPGALSGSYLATKASRTRSTATTRTAGPSANTRLKALRALFAWAVENDEAPHDPTAGVKRIKHVSPGFHSWSLDEIKKFERKHSIGSKARLAMGLLLYTACRREDVDRLGPQHVRDGRLKYRQAKNEHRNPVDLEIPVHPDLMGIIEPAPTKHLTFLTTAYGRAFTAAGFGNAFRRWCDEAGLSNCSAHGLRKATAARLAERGATTHEIMSITGHRSLEEVERYTRAARQRTLADAAMAKIRRRTKLVPPD